MSGAGAREPGAAHERRFMQRALRLARRGWGHTAPNPMVGAVVVRDGEVVGEGWHASFGGPHAEVMALDAAGERARGATVYVTLEPCAHTGKTPPCTDALLAAGVARVVAATRDPSTAARGGLDRLAAAGVEVSSGRLGDQARELNAAFLHAQTATRPWLTLKLATSIDGAIADAAGRSRWLTGPRARREVHRLRAGHDAIAVGIGTALADDPSLTVRGQPAPRRPPRRVVFDRSARLPLHSQLVRSARECPTVVVCADPASASARALAAAGVDLVRAGSLPEALEALRRLEIRSLLVEGGARLAGALIASALVDRLIIFQAPLLLGSDALRAFAYVPGAELPLASRFPVVEQRRLGEDTMTVYAVHPLPCSPA